MADLHYLQEQTTQDFAAWIQSSELAQGELTLEVDRHHLLELCLQLRDKPKYAFQTLIDVCAVDYLHYGRSEWQTESTTGSGFARGVRGDFSVVDEVWTKPRFAVVYHFLSLENNHRLRLRAFVDDEQPAIASLVGLWPAANWFEREAFDLFGIIFNDHPDLRRLLTDYGFIGHPFRKDFPLIGNIEVRYDATLKRVVYEPVSIEPRILEPKVIRHDNRYTGEKSGDR